MKYLFICGAVLLTLAIVFGLGIAGPGAAGTDPDTASCAACHAGPLSLSAKSGDELTAALAAIARGEKPHPTDLTGLDDETIAEIVAALNP